MELLDSLSSLSVIRYAPMMLAEIIWSAGTVFLATNDAIIGVNHANISLSDSRSQLDRCLKYLSEIGHSWHCGNDTRETLLRLYDELNCRLDGRPHERQPEFEGVGPSYLAT